MPRAAPDQAFHLRQRKSARAKITADRHHRGHHRQRIDYPVLTRLADGVAQPPLAQLRGHQRAATGRTNRIDQPRLGMRGKAERDHARGMALGLGAQPRIVRAVGRNDCHTAFNQTLENLALGVGDLGLILEKADMCGRDRRHDCNVRAHQPRQLRQFARMVHAHLEHAELRARRHPRQAQRHADMVVVAFQAAVRATPATVKTTTPIERGEQCLFDPGLARRTGYADDFCGMLHPRPRCARQRLQRGKGIGHQHMRLRNRPIDHHRCRAARKGTIEEFVPVGRFALERKEQVALGHLTAIDLDPCNLEFGRCHAPDRRRKFTPSP